MPQVFPNVPSGGKWSGGGAGRMPTYKSSGVLEEEEKFKKEIIEELGLGTPQQLPQQLDGGGCPVQHIHSGSDTPKIKTSNLEDDASLFSSGLTSKSRAYLAGAQTVATGAEVLIELETESYDVDSEFDTSTHLFTALKAGYYHLSAAAWITPATADKQYSLSIYKNAGRACRTIVHSSHVQNFAPSVSTVVSLAVGDTVSLYVGHNEAGNITVETGEAATYLSIYRLS